MIHLSGLRTCEINHQSYRRTVSEAAQEANGSYCHVRQDEAGVVV